MSVSLGLGSFCQFSAGWQYELRMEGKVINSAGLTRVNHEQAEPTEHPGCLTASQPEISEPYSAEPLPLPNSLLVFKPQGLSYFHNVFRGSPGK